MTVLAFPESGPQARALAQQLDLTCQDIQVHVFPDRESLLHLPASLPEQVILVRSLDDPNAKLIELMLAAQTARRLGVQRIVLVAPYLCYMRQDMEFTPGQAVSQPIIGRFLAQHCDALVTVDPHLHRVSRLQEAVPVRQAIALSAAPLIGHFIAGQCQQPLLVGPDEESLQWVRQAAQQIGCDYVVAHKIREGDTRVRVQLPEYAYAGRHAVLLDDMVSTGHTLMRTAERLRERGVTRIDAACTHALFDADTERQLHEAGIERLWSSDSIAHPSNRIPLQELLAEALKQLKL